MKTKNNRSITDVIFRQEAVGAQLFQRGLSYQEISIIKRMRIMGHPRDYIFSFLIRPGRKLTPACISEVEKGKIGLDVGPATDHEVDVFIAKRLSESSDPDRFYGPLSSFQIHQELGWIERSQGDLYRDETHRVEFKIKIPSKDEDLIKYAKTMSAFSNNVGGYIFFGISDERRVVGVDEADFLSFDWEKLSIICREYFQPDIEWDREIVHWREKNLGVIYTNQADQKPIVAAKSGKALTAGSIYYRYRGHTETIRPGDLFKLLAERDRRTREDAWATDSKAPLAEPDRR